MASKQQKIQSKIALANGKAGHAQPLGTKPNDECYTSMDDILTELAPWGGLGKFQGKNIICPCDWDIVDNEEIYSIHIVYNIDDTDIIGNDVKIELGLFDEENKISIIDLKEDKIDDFLHNKLTCNFIRTLTQNARRWGIKSITASGYNPANGKGIPFQKVDYSKYDICITNPPFSLYNEFMECIVGNIDFIILAPFLNRVTPNVGLYLMRKKAYLGWGVLGHITNNNMHLNFDNPTTDNEYKTKQVACDWITSFSEAQEDRNEQLKIVNSGVSYELYKDEYIEMPNMTMKDGTHPIRVPSKAFPDDFTGWMFTAVNAISEINTDEYEWYGTNFVGYFNTTKPEMNPFTHKLTSGMLKIGDKQMFGGIVFRKKPKQEGESNES